MTIKPLDNRVAVKYMAEEERTKSGIVLPDTAKEEKPQQGEVIAVGKGCFPEDKEEEVKVGDIVVFDKYAGTKVNLNDEEYVIVSIDDVLAVIEK